MHKVLIANRGAIARRIVRACATLKISSVVVFAPADAEAPYLSEATEAYPLIGNTALETYLDQAQLLAIAKRCGADAVHPGYGFLSENPTFASKVCESGLIFIGPSPTWLEQMGDKVAARTLLAQAGFSVFAGSGLVQSADEAARALAKIGLPLVVKPSGGGGGMGMSVVRTESELNAAIERSRHIATQAFSADGVFLERWIERPRHIEFQILADGAGGAMHLYERECSVQRRHQKLIEEAPAPGLSRALLNQQADLAERICGELGYDNVGTLETLYEDSGQFGFLEMNTRIQVEHGVTEAVTGLDLVATQIRLAAGDPLPADRPPLQGFAVEARLYAEDTQTGFPSTGRLTVFRPPELYAVRIETGFQEGQWVTPYFDPLLAKIIAHGDTREQAIGRVLVALRAFSVEGVTTNRDLLSRVLRDQAFLRGELDTGIVSRLQRG
tara:strand:- start:107 stop:1435 length:1329 start_codon:yes stop_codon:yes gene_type:complete